MDKIDRKIMYFLGTAELLKVENLIVFSTIYIQDFVLCLPFEAILYSYFSFGGTCFVCCIDVIRISESPFWEVPLYIIIILSCPCFGVPLLLSSTAIHFVVFLNKKARPLFSFLALET